MNGLLMGVVGYSEFCLIHYLEGVEQEELCKRG